MSKSESKSTASATSSARRIPKKSPRSPLQVQDSNAPIMPAQVDAALVPAPVIP